MSNNEKEKSQGEGLDMLNWQPDYTKSKKENDQAFREAYFKAYGEYPPEDKE